MCLAIPGRILNITDETPLTRRGKVSFGGIVREINLAFVPEAEANDFVMVHVGFAISQIDESEANKVFEYLKKMDEMSEIEEASS